MSPFKFVQHQMCNSSAGKHLTCVVFIVGYPACGYTTNRVTKKPRFWPEKTFKLQWPAAHFNLHAFLKEWFRIISSALCRFPPCGIDQPRRAERLEQQYSTLRIPAVENRGLLTIREGKLKAKRKRKTNRHFNSVQFKSIPSGLDIRENILKGLRLFSFVRIEFFFI